MEMELHLLRSPVSTPSLYPKPNPPIQCVRSSKRSSGPTTQKELSRILRTEAAVKNIERKSNSQKKYNNLWPKPVLEALDHAIANNHWQTALKIFGLLRKQHWYEPRCQTYAKLFMMLGTCKQPEEAGLLFELMLTDGLKPTVDVYTALVSVYGKSGLFDKTFSTVDDMKSTSDCIPDVYTYSILISCCTRFRRYDLIEQVLAEMSYLGIGCNTVIYNTLIDGYGKYEMFELMEESLTDMVESGSCIPDVFTLNSFLGAYGRSGQIDKMEKWYDEFQLMGIKPDLKTFNILIKSYGKARMFEKMGSVMEFMKRRYFTPTIVTYNIVIEVFGKAGNIVKMEEYFRKMKQQGMKPNSVTYCSLVSAYSKTGNINQVDSILRQVENSDVILDTAFFNCIISAYGRAGDINKMGELFLTMEEKKCAPDHITFATMIQACNALGMTAAAENLKNRKITTLDNSGSRLIRR
ncbi:pentatricopeptide repeat-containing protein At3g53170 [Argentina anserina]|uniref:pentatricopeptide repeat-containing protein At3g53170 n=1 Tax=Argentina anserina TaxID=57926 RepID=UPI0021765561|nr:pentatricopeptide repeat-containing protein At3g53170 [Potentilla anserina]